MHVVQADGDKSYVGRPLLHSIRFSPLEDTLGGPLSRFVAHWGPILSITGASSSPPVNPCV